MSLPRARRPVRRSQAGLGGRTHRTEVASHSRGLSGRTEPASSPPRRPALRALNGSHLPFPWTDSAMRAAALFQQRAVESRKQPAFVCKSENPNQPVCNSSPVPRYQTRPLHVPERDRPLWPQGSPGIPTQIPARPARELSCVLLMEEGLTGKERGLEGRV